MARKILYWLTYFLTKQRHIYSAEIANVAFVSMENVDLLIAYRTISIISASSESNSAND